MGVFGMFALLIFDNSNMGNGFVKNRNNPIIPILDYMKQFLVIVD